MTTNRKKKINIIANEKLAHIFARSNDISVCEYCVYDNRCDAESSCYDGILQWLNQGSKGQ